MSVTKSVKDASAEVCYLSVQATLKFIIKVVLRVFTAHKNSQVEASVNSLSDAELDVAMKYVYKAFSMNKDGTTCAR